MSHLRKTDLSYIKGQIQDGRFTIGFIRIYLTMVLLLSGFLVGLSYAVANANTVGWDTLSSGWHTIYYLEAILFSIHLLMLLFCRANNSLNQKILMVGLVLFTYKAALDPYITISMFLKDSGTYTENIGLIMILISIGVLLHIIAFIFMVKKLKKNIDALLEQPKEPKVTIGIPVLFMLVTLVSIIMNNGYLGDFELMFGILLFSGIYIGMLIGVCEFILASYAVFRFPSFSVNPPVNQYYKRKKKKKR